MFVAPAGFQEIERSSIPGLQKQTRVQLSDASHEIVEVVVRHNAAYGSAPEIHAERSVTTINGHTFSVSEHQSSTGKFQAALVWQVDDEISLTVGTESAARQTARDRAESVAATVEPR